MASLGNKLDLVGDVQKRGSSSLGITREEHFSLHTSLCQAHREGHTRAAPATLLQSGPVGALLCRMGMELKTMEGRLENNCCSLSRLRPALGECLARLAAAMPVAFLEPELNEYNACSVYTTKSPRERASELRGLGQLAVRVTGEPRSAWSAP